MMKKGGMQLRNSPDIPVLHQLLSKAVQKPGEKQHCSWRHSDGLPLMLDVLNPLKERFVQWQLFCDKSGKRTMLFECVGHDILMVFNQISAAINDLPTSMGRPEENSRVLRARQARAKQAQEAEVTVTVSTPGSPLVQKVKPTFEMPAVSDAAGGAPAARATASIDMPKPGKMPSRAFADAIAQQTVSAKPFDIEDTVVNHDGQSVDVSHSKTVETVKPTLPKPILSVPDKTIETVKPALPKPQLSSQQEAYVEPPGQYPLQGDLREVAPLKLLQMLKNEQVTGRLRIDSNDVSAVIYLRDGNAVEAIHGEDKGDDALLEILQWSEGNFALTAGMRSSGTNIDSTPEELLSRQAKLSVLLEKLSLAGLTTESTFARSNNNLSKDAFYATVSPGAPVDADQLAELYMAFDGVNTLADLGEYTDLRDLKLLQAINHLVELDLVTFGGEHDGMPVEPAIQPIHEAALESVFEPKKYTPPQPVMPRADHKPNPLLQPPPQNIVRLASGKPLVEPKVIDGKMIESVIMSLRRTDTGLFLFPAFLYFLEEEFFRVYRSKGNLSVLLFELRELEVTPEGLLRKPLPAAAIVDASMRMAKRKRHTDVVAHYEEHDFAILLPGTASGGTRVFVNKIIKVLAESPLSGMAGRPMALSFGSASIPEDFTNLNSLLGAAELSMRQARDTGKIYLPFKDV